MILSKGLQNYVESVKYSKHDHLHDDKVQSTNKKIHRLNKINSILAYWLVHFIDEIKLSSRSWSNISAAFLYCRFFLFDLQRNMNELSTKIKDICLFILLKCCHNCGENVFAVWAAELSVLLPSPDPLCQCQTAYSAIGSCLVLFIGLDDWSLIKTTRVGSLTIYSFNKQELQ